MLLDAHCHPTFSAQPGAFALDAARRELALLACTVEPTEFELAAQLFAAFCHVRLGLGLHPWWIQEPAEDGRCCASRRQVDQLAALLPQASFIGEVGLDFAPRHEVTKAQQLEAFGRIVRLCAVSGDRVISLHCVKAYDELLSLLEDSGCVKNNTCILHWFSGTSDQLQRAIGLGCWFSVSQRMLQSKRGRAYLAAMPLNRVLLETDLPDQGSEDVDASMLHEALEEARKGVIGVWAQKGVSAEQGVNQLAENSRAIWDRL